MRTEHFKHEGVKPDGTFENEPGAVITTGGVRMSANNGGCGIDTCHCSDGHWISIISPRTEQGIVEGMKMIFDNKKEMEEYLRNN